ncbi:hypothetical protein [Priestia taiwanensis]|uniref:Uncharacterized protein n=1 Tax=Priestia taiwanensis TaxID=1347902 RepID=A0A917EN94_9BACI|nr:hypothetical protein [Priestia taiwanensis]MBM7362041.1 hypothetical protein [Priestia taiwanensis]GGE58993.1 hypothetical protein GCM10007140_06660 [Priestia taiwanensis]
MNYTVDPSLHVVDTHQAFIISAKNIHLQLNIKEEEKSKVYNLVQRLKRNQIEIESMLNDSSFESQVVKVFINKGIIQQKIIESSQSFKGIKRIFANKDLLRVLKETVTDECEIRDNTCTTFLEVICEEEPVGRDIFIYILQDSLFVSLSRVDNVADHHIVNSKQLQYIAFVLIEKMSALMMKLKEDISVKIDLTFYENEVTGIVMDGIDENNFFTSMFTNEILHNVCVDVDYDCFFPLVHLLYRDIEKGVRIEALGFDKYDSARNLLSLLSNAYKEITIYRNDSDVINHKLNTPSFIGKFTNLYFGKELHVCDEMDKKVLFLDTYKVQIPLEKYSKNEYSYFLTLYLDTLNRNKGGMINGNILVQR